MKTSLKLSGIVVFAVFLFLFTISNEIFSQTPPEKENNPVIPLNPGTSRVPLISGDPEGDTFQRKVFDAPDAGGNYGNSISDAGDVNGDGYDDIITGAYGLSSYTGKVYIYYGGQNMNTGPDVILSGEASSNFFGFSVSKAGDVNGDGYDDVIVGAFGYNSATGRAYIFYGGASMNTVSDVTMTGAAVNNNFGVAVSEAGDVNGDGYSDVIVGSDIYNSSTGRAFIFFGGVSMNNVVDVTLTGQATFNYFGGSVSAAGDVNGDGFSDVIAGASGYSSNTGRAYIFYGGASMNNVADVTMTGGAVNDYFGVSVSKAGDINGDGFSDVITGANGYNTNTGRAYIFYGGASMNNIADITVTGETTSTSFGYSVSEAGDVNGDSYPDVIVGASSYVSFTGKAYIFFGGPSMNNIFDATMTGEATFNWFGNMVSSAGDVNGDGYSDVLTGAYGYNSSAGRVYLFDYFMKGEITADVIAFGYATNDYLGASVAGAGDVNGDGYSDAIAGAPNSTGPGDAYIYFGGVTDNIPDIILTGEAAGNRFGINVASAGDVNGDGYSDVIVGADRYNDNVGRSYIFFGGAVMDNIADVIMTGESALSTFGFSCASVNDINGDGYDDVIVGAYEINANRGKAYIYYGGALMNNSADLTLVGENTLTRFGLCVSSAGDLNNDGFPDIAVGGPQYNSGAGRVYIFYGSTSMDSVADVTLTGQFTSNFFGYSVSAGDVNNDNYSDLIVSAFGYTNYTGRVYIYYGGTVFNNTADVTVNGEALDSYLGVSVSGDGDINGDGYDDVIIGASEMNNRTGRSYVLFGRTMMDNNIDLTMSGIAASDDFGFSVSFAGDMNADGYSELIVGAHGAGATGSASIYFGSQITLKPVLNSVKDIPNDQGGKVNLKWFRSAWELYGVNNVTNYLIYRSQPPGPSGFVWEQIGDVAAVNSPSYTFTANTLTDSSAGSSGNTYFYIKAKNINTGDIWNSNILSGKSIDNIAPPTVTSFSSTLISNNVRLNWRRNTAPDLLNYKLFRSTAPTINPYTATPLATTTDSTFLDTSPLSGLSYYFIVAQDIHNNLSPVTVAESPNMTLNLTMFIQGFYNAASNLQVSDTVRVFLRNNFAPYNIVDNSKAVVSPNGSATLKFANAANGTYYVVLTHRNSIETWSSAGIALTKGSSSAYDFTNALSKAYGNNLIQIDASPLRYSVHNGDVNQDGMINLTDLINIYNDGANFATGYKVTDVNGDNIVNLTDLLIANNNSSAFVRRFRP